MSSIETKDEAAPYGARETEIGWEHRRATDILGPFGTFWKRHRRRDNERRISAAEPDHIPDDGHLVGSTWNIPPCG